MTAPVWIDGQPGNSLPTSDRGLLYGDGVFETIRLHRGKPILWPEHLQRLLNSCLQLGIPCDASLVEEQLAGVLTWFERQAGSSAVLKIIVTRGEGGRGYAPPVATNPRIIMQLHPLPDLISQHAERGVRSMLCEHPVSVNPALAGLKHLNRLDQVMASRELAAARAVDAPAADAPTDSTELFEGLMSDGQGLLIEGTRSNVFLVIADQLCTPDLSRAGVAGVIRGWLIEQFQASNTPVQIRDIPLDELRIASEVFICNSVLGVMPVIGVYTGHPSMCAEISYRHHDHAHLAQGWLQDRLGI